LYHRVASITASRPKRPITRWEVWLVAGKADRRACMLGRASNRYLDPMTSLLSNFLIRQIARSTTPVTSKRLVLVCELCGEYEDCVCEGCKEVLFEDVLVRRSVALCSKDEKNRQS
jgi:hypothetical protein